MAIWGPSFKILLNLCCSFDCQSPTNAPPTVDFRKQFMNKIVFFFLEVQLDLRFEPVRKKKWMYILGGGC